MDRQQYFGPDSLSARPPYARETSSFGYDPAALFIPKEPATRSVEVETYELQHMKAKSSTPPPKGWPTGPRLLRETTWHSYLSVAWNIFVALLPVIFLFLGFSALHLHHRPRSGFGDAVVEACKYGTTAFPIVFAAVVAKLMRATALWSCEKGSSLGFLEQLTGSLSLAGTVERFFSLRRFDVFGIAIVILWLLSPIGSQLSLRMLTISDLHVIVASEMKYFDVVTPDGSAVGGPFEGASSLTSGRAGLTALVSASMLASENVTKSPQDQWGNLKIPLVDEVEDLSEHPNNDWIPLGGLDNHNWASLSGLMMVGFPDGSSNATFTVETSYFNVSCSDNVKLSAKDPIFDNLATINASKSLWASGGQWNSLFVDKWKTSGDQSDKPTVNLAFGSDAASLNSVNGQEDDPSVEFYNCTVSYPQVEANVTCHGSFCGVTEIRRSNSSTASATSPSSIFNSIPFLSLLNFIPGSLGFPHSGSTSQIEQYLLGSDSPFSIGISDLAAPGYSKIPGKDFAKRLTTVMNTIWQANLCPLSISLGASANFTDPNSSDVSGFKECPSATTTAQAEYIKPRAQYTAHKTPTIALLLISFILETCAIVALVLRAITKAPDILGYVSTMTRNNEHTHVPEGGNTLSGIHRARHLGDLKVRLSDVRSGEGVGHVALESLEGSRGGKAGGLDRRRLYF